MSKGQGVPIRRELRAPAKPQKVAAEPYRYTVDGERVTLDEIVARCSAIKPQTVKRRVEMQGMRTWSDLQRAVVAGYRSSQKRRGAI